MLYKSLIFCDFIKYFLTCKFLPSFSNMETLSTLRLLKYERKNSLYIYISLIMLNLEIDRSTKIIRPHFTGSKSRVECM